MGQGFMETVHKFGNQAKACWLVAMKLTLRRFLMWSLVEGRMFFAKHINSSTLVANAN